jgi:hypothetical protein
MCAWRRRSGHGGRQQGYALPTPPPGRGLGRAAGRRPPPAPRGEVGENEMSRVSKVESPIFILEEVYVGLDGPLGWLKI